MDTLKDRFLTIKEHYSFTYNDGLAIYGFTLQAIGYGIAEYSVQSLPFAADTDIWEQIGKVALDIESAGDTDAVIQHCRKIYGVPAEVTGQT